jgi:hypothetical protein
MFETVEGSPIANCSICGANSATLKPTVTHEASAAFLAPAMPLQTLRNGRSTKIPDGRRSGGDFRLNGGVMGSGAVQTPWGVFKLPGKGKCIVERLKEGASTFPFLVTSLSLASQ